jgi:hypothetical protein
MKAQLSRLLTFKELLTKMLKKQRLLMRLLTKVCSITQRQNLTGLRKARQWEMRWARENPFFTEDERAELQELAKKEPAAARAFREGYFSKSSGVDSGLDTDFSGG